MEDGNPWVAILVTILLIAVNGVLASTEIAMMGVSETKLKDAAAKGDKKTKLLLRMKQAPSDFLSTIQIGITLAGLLSGAFAADSLAEPITRWAASMGVTGFALSAIDIGSIVLITILITYFMLVFGELVPKRLAMVHPEKVARRYISPINILAKLTKPLVRLLAASTNLVLRMLGITPDDEDAPVTEDEILLLVREGHEQGTIEDSEAAVVTNVFEFTDTLVEDAMTHRTEMFAVPADATIPDVVKLMNESSFSRFPVYEDNKDTIVGIIYSKDVLAQYSVSVPGQPLPKVRDVMRPPFFVMESTSLSQLFKDMKKTKNTMAVVVDEHGGTSGIITLMDIIQEIVGDIELDYLEDIQDLGDGSYRIDGSVDMDDVAELLKLDVDVDLHDTLSGFVIAQLGYIPAAGPIPSVQYGGYDFKIEQMDGALARSVLVRRLEPAPAVQSEAQSE